MLDSVNWDFPTSGNASPVHILPRYPGNFIHQIPSYLINILSQPGEIVWDPFGGCGTSAIEAIRSGRKALSTDALTISAFIAELKNTLLTTKIDPREAEATINEFVWKQLCTSDQNGKDGEGSDPVLTDWYSEITLGQLRFIWSIIERVSKPLNAAMVIAFFSTLSSCASTGQARTKTGGIRKNHWGWIADNVTPKPPIDHDAIGIFVSHLKMLLSAPELGESHHSFEIHQVDIASNESVERIGGRVADLVVTSPPYLGMIDYAKAHRLQYLWMNWDLPQDMQHEIGARYTRNRKYAVEDYLDSIDNSFRNIFGILKPGRYCAIVVGESSKFKGLSDEVIQTIGSHGKVVWGPSERAVSRRRVNARLNTRPNEKLCVFLNEQ